MIPYKVLNIERHFFKFRFDGYIRTKCFSNSARLWRYIRKNKPLDCYYSLNESWNPKTADKEKNSWLFKRYSCVDIDDTDRENCIRIVSILKENSFPIDYILQTSENSLQIKLNGFYDDKIKEILKGLDYCKSTLNDKKRVIRLPLSIHKSGFKTTFLTKSLDNFKGIPKNKIKEEKKKHDFYYSYLKQSVISDRYILFVKCSNPSKKLNYLYKKNPYLGDVYILDYHNDKLRYGLLFPKSMIKRKLDKIQKTQHFIRTSKKRNEKLILSEKPKLIQIINKSDIGHYSKLHMNFLRILGANKKYPIEIGKDKSEFIGRFRG